MSLFALFINTPDTTAKIQQQIRYPVEKAGLSLLVCVHINTAIEELKKQEAAGTRLAFILLGPNLEKPVTVARQLQQEATLSQLAFLVNGTDTTALRQQLKSPLAMVGRQWRIIDLAAENLTALLEDALRAARQQLQLRTTLNRVNSQLASHPSVDISEQRRHIVSDRFLANILEHAQDAIISTNNNDIIITWNNAAERMFGLPQDDAVGMPIEDVAGGDWSEQVPGLIAQIRASESASNRQELVCRRSDGQPLNVELMLSVVSHESGQPIGISAIIRDITERKQAEQVLLESEERLRAILDNSPAVIYMLDAENRYIFVNPLPVRTRQF